MMRKTPWFRGSGWAVAFLAMGTCLGLGTAVFGRVGETQPQIEDRLLANPSAMKLGEAWTILDKYLPEDENGGGQRNGARGRTGSETGLIVIRDGFDFQVVDDLVREAAGLDPATPNSEGIFHSDEFPMHNYLKTDDGTPAQRAYQNKGEMTGWELQVYMYKGVSVLEVYRRIHKPLADTEISLILEANRGPSKWKEENAEPSTSGQGGSFLGYDYVREDGMERALKVGSDLVIFSAGLDKRLVDLVDKARSLQNASTKGTAPISVQGF